MGKRKPEDNPTTPSANGDSKKRQRVSEEENPAAAKKAKKERKEKKYGKKVKTELVPEEDIVDVAMTEIDNIKPEAAKKEEEGDATEPAAAPEAAAAGEKTDKKKKRKKNKKAAAKEEAAAGDEEEKAEQEGQEGEEVDGEAAEAASSGKPKKSRFIVFVGNLPYSAKVADIEKHFSAVQPTSIRLLHEKANPTKSRGIAFLEFRGYDHMKTCLKTMHHSTMTCEGRDYRGRPKMEDRQINVELTAGGGGNTDGRKEKIRAKNEKLNEQRERRRIEEEKQKVKKEQERLAKAGEQKAGADGIHPSRRARVPGNRFK
ncbi:hypothetical protein BKA67DRAFT_575568 [Truncatella angustata]|uniref:RRM domain-containing protein n=1 Tax=Truncatella angustata TaxID=152316 RepID=A0A9P8UEZ6_9PEZI|nr:uncharacterized protein BKA67DRAFT_575568 [Truncatella angustata]KAH6648704.1 hypothetical protein BKA67DRAFT_575568 [Truncatella angustata]KAH8194941.1 hypothetical protein TruAng_010882 [Truncatella angustata]